MMWIQFLRDRRASVAPIFAIALLPMLIATGAAIDFSRAFRQRTVVQDSLDAAALAAGKQLGIAQDSDVKLEAQNFYNSNIGAKVDIKPTMTPTITANQPTLTLVTQLHVPTYFLGLIGVNEFVFNLTSQSTQAMGTLEVALALDNSTSMCLGCSAADQNSTDTKIGTLKSAANSLVTTLYGLSTTSTKPDPVKIAVVPFAGAVNVGSAATWVDKVGAGAYAADSMKDATLLGAAANTAPASFNPFSVFSTLKDSDGNAITWAGCVEERPAPYDISDDAPSTSASPSTEEKKTLFEPMVAPDEPDNWNCSTGSCDYLGSTSATRRYNGTPTGSQTYNNYLPDAGDSTTCGTVSATVTSTSGTPGRLNRTSHGLTAGTAITLTSTNTLPAGLNSTTTYYVSPAGLASGSFYLATTTTGSSVTLNNGYVTLTSISNAKAALFTATAHGLSVGDDIILATGGTLPGGLATGTTYYVASTTANTFTVTTATSGTAVTVTKSGTAGTFTTTANHGLAVNDAVVLAGGTMYTGLSTNTVYYVKTVPTSKTFTLATTSGGTAVSLSGSQSGTHTYVKVVATTTAGSGTHSFYEPGTPTTFTSTSHGLSVGDAIAIGSSGTIPTGLSASTIYYVASKTTNTFTLATVSSSGTVISNVGTYSGTLNFIELVATTSNGTGTHSYLTNATAYTCANGDCSGGVTGRTEKQAFGGQSVTSAPMCKYGTAANKATVADITVANLTGVGSFGPNFGCSTNAITSLTVTQSTVTSAITAMKANGYTNITSGLMWAWRVLSNGEPFTQGRPDNTEDNQKIIVLMTDGENTYLPYLQADQNPSTSTTYAGKFVKSAYGAWGYIAENHLATTATTSQPIMDKLNARLTAACTAAKAAKIRIYTVGFEIDSTSASDPVATKALLRGCATDPAKYFDAQNKADLIAAFTAIGDDISLLRLSM